MTAQFQLRGMFSHIFLPLLLLFFSNAPTLSKAQLDDSPAPESPHPLSRNSNGGGGGGGGGGGLDDTNLTSPAWIVTGPNQTTDAVPSCSYCLQVFVEQGSDSNDFTDLPVYVSRCRSFEARELWQYSSASNHLLVRDKTGQLLCLQYKDQEDAELEADDSDLGLTVTKCKGGPKQKWFLDSDKRIRSAKTSEEGSSPLYLAQTGVLEYPNLLLLTDAGIANASNGVTTTEFTFEDPASYWANPGLSLRRDSKNDVPTNSTQNLIQSGGFERSTIAPGWPAGEDCSVTPLPPLCSSTFYTAGEIFPLCGWIIISPPEWISGRDKWRPARGNSSLLLSDQAIINQTIPTVTNLRYKVSFNLAGYLTHSATIDDYVVCPNTTDVSSPDLRVKVFSGSNTTTATFFVTQFSTDSHLRWLNATMNFTAHSNITVVEFSSLRIDSCAPLIDEVRVAPRSGF